MNNNLIEFSEENIFLEFELEDQRYVVISQSPDLVEGDEIYLAKIDIVDNERIIRSIESDEEYQEVEKEYERIVEEYLEDDENV